MDKLDLNYIIPLALAILFGIATFFQTFIKPLFIYRDREREQARDTQTSKEKIASIEENVGKIQTEISRIKMMVQIQNVQQKAIHSLFTIQQKVKQEISQQAGADIDSMKDIQSLIDRGLQDLLSINLQQV